MPLFIDQNTFIDVTNLTLDYARRKLRGVKRTGNKNYCTSSILTQLQFKFAESIVAASHDDGEILVSDDAEMIEALERRILSVPAMALRARTAQRNFTFSLVAGRGSHVFAQYYEVLRSRVLLDSKVLQYVVCGTGTPPDSKDWAAAFAIVNSSFDQETMTPTEFRELARAA